MLSRIKTLSMIGVEFFLVLGLTPKLEVEIGIAMGCCMSPGEAYHVVKKRAAA